MKSTSSLWTAPTNLVSLHVLAKWAGRAGNTPGPGSSLSDQGRPVGEMIAPGEPIRNPRGFGR